QSVFPSTSGGVVAHFTEVGVATLLISAGALLTRRLPGMTWALILWAGASLMVAAVSRQPYAHYLTPAVVPLSLLLASAPLPRALREMRRSTLLRLTPQATGLVLAALLARVAGLDWVPAASPSP